MTAWTPHHLLAHLMLPPPGYRPPPGHIDVWTWHADPDTVSRSQNLQAILDGTERRRANGFLSTDRRDTYTLAQVALRLVLARCFSTAPQSVDLLPAPCPGCKGPHGRPMLRESNVHFSLAQTRTTVMIALAQSPVGIELETIDRAGPALLLQLPPQEKETIRRLPSGHRSQALLEYWVRSEAYLKVRGNGITPSSCRRMTTGRGSAHTHQDAALAGCSLTSVTAPPGHAAAAALHTGIHRPSTGPAVAYHGCDQCGRPAATADPEATLLMQ